MKVIVLAFLAVACSVAGEELSVGDIMLEKYFEAEVGKIEAGAFDGLEAKEDWEGWKTGRRGELFSMLGLDPKRERTALKPVVTGALERDGIVVENLHFQSSPGLYVTGNLYRPKEVKGKLPTVLYVCGHGGVKKDGVSFGNKTHYHYHGAWFARNGYVCLIIDTLQLGEIEGMHHGTYRFGRWDWVCRGYSPAAVEAWNGMRALDYLETRDEVDADRMGVTGRSGGGAYSWYLAALDDRIRVAVPVAGITSLRDHVVGRCVDGHCDCMYMVNSARWSFAELAALVAPRPLLIENTDKDPIFPLGGVVDVYNKARGVYKLLGAEANIGLVIAEGPHSDTQELQVPAFRWFERNLKGADPVPLVTDQAVKVFEPEELRVFKDGLPEDEVNTVIGDSFTELAGDRKGGDFDKGLPARLRTEVFGGWPEEGEAGEGLETKLVYNVANAGMHMKVWDFTSESGIPLRLYLVHGQDMEALGEGNLDLPKLDEVVIRVMDEESWDHFRGTYGGAGVFGILDRGEIRVAGGVFTDAILKVREFPRRGLAFIAPRGIGPTAWKGSAKREHQVRRSFVLLGQTLDGMRVWDVRRAVRALRGIDGLDKVKLTLAGRGDMAGVALYAALFEEGIDTIELLNLPVSHRDGPTFMNVLRVWDLADAVEFAQEKGIEVKMVKGE